MVTRAPVDIRRGYVCSWHCLGLVRDQATSSDVLSGCSLLAGRASHQVRFAIDPFALSSDVACSAQRCGLTATAPRFIFRSCCFDSTGGTSYGKMVAN